MNVYEPVIKCDRSDPDALEQDEDYVSMSLDEYLDMKALAIEEEWREEKTNE